MEARAVVGNEHMRPSREDTSTSLRQKGRVPASLQALFIQNCRTASEDSTHHTSQVNRNSNENAQEERNSAISTRQVHKPTSASELQDYFDSLLRERGYHNVRTYNTLSTGYYHRPTELQLASYGPKVLELVKTNNISGMYEALTVAGLSPNPCNAYGESLVHMACRRGYTELLNLMVHAGAALQICDDYGRTPLHDACWTGAAQPALDIVHQLTVDCDRCMWFLKDSRGALPLSCVDKDHVKQWKDWLDAHMDSMFPPMHCADNHANPVTNKLLLVHPQNESRGISPLSVSAPISASLMKLEPLSVELIQMVAKGALSPREARVMSEIANRGEDEETVADTITTLDDDDDDESDWDDDSSSDLSSVGSNYDMVHDAMDGGYEYDHDLFLGSLEGEHVVRLIPRKE